MLNVLRLPNDLDWPNGVCELGESPDSLHHGFTDNLAHQISADLPHLHPLQLRRRICDSLQRLISEIIQQPKLVVVPHLVRPAVVEACNIELDAFPLIVEGDTHMSLTGEQEITIETPIP